MPGPVITLDVPGLAPPAGPYAHATRLGDHIFVSGLLALDAEGRLVGAGDIALQARHIFETLAVILHAGGSELADVAKLTFYLTDLSGRAALTEVRLAMFGTARPASTLVQVAGLIGDGTLIEVDAVAAAGHPP